MDGERIERLAMDRALGELNEDAAALFDTYLAEHPEIQAQAKDMAEMCLQMRTAIDRKTLVPNTGRNHADTHRPWPSRVRWTHMGRWAALLLVAAGIGMTMGRWSQPRVPASDVTAVRSESDAGPDSEQQLLSRPGFWQDKALALLQTTPYARTGSHDSETSLWGRYRQYRKERSHE